jgi:hypothetical protein
MVASNSPTCRSNPAEGVWRLELEGVTVNVRENG